MTWAIKTRYGFEAVELVKETAKTATYIDRRWSNNETRVELSGLLDWRGDEEAARALVAKLTSAQAEFDRRRNAAIDWYSARKAEIIAAAKEGQGA
jgi:hypothetical protein